jgi:hypothetical protein
MPLADRAARKQFLAQPFAIIGSDEHGAQGPLSGLAELPGRARTHSEH